MICLYGGTFDPVHFGHLRTAIEVQQAVGIEQVHLLPCGTPPHRGQPHASAEQRLKLLELAIADQTALTIDDRELRRDGPSFMVDTLRSIREDVADQPVCLVLGMDAFSGLESWHQWQAIPELAHLLVMQRPGSNWPDSGELSDWVKKRSTNDCKALFKQAAGLIVGVQVTQLEISSTRIRALLAADKSPRYLLPDAVLDHIQKNNWY
jgi:nicotinate-nucleotide adenylyltransferase